MANGIPASSIAIDARGETQPAVDTPDGDREQDNRRVDVVFGEPVRSDP